MTCILYDAPCAIEPIGDQTPDFAVGLFRARHPLERIEFDAWFNDLTEALPTTL